jgi:hypothetical protein
MKSKETKMDEYIEKLKQEAVALSEKLNHKLQECKDAPCWMSKCKKCKMYVRIKEPCYSAGEPYLIGPTIVLPCKAE